MADGLSLAWKAQRTSMRARQRLVRALITTMIADEKAGEIVLVIRWKGGQSELRLRKPKTGEHGCCTPKDAILVIQAWPSAGDPPPDQREGHRQRAGHAGRPAPDPRRFQSEQVAAVLKRKGRPCRVNSEISDLNVSRYLRRRRSITRPSRWA